MRRSALITENVLMKKLMSYDQVKLIDQDGRVTELSVNEFIQDCVNIANETV